MDTAVLSKSEILENMRHGWDEWESLLAEVGWSMREIVAHLSPYTRRSAVRLEHALAGTTLAPGDLYGTEDVPDMSGRDEDDFNAWSVGRTLAQPTDQIVAGFADAWSRMEAAIGALSEEDFATPGRFGWTRGRPVFAILPINSDEHQEMRVPTIRGWLAANPR